MDTVKGTVVSLETRAGSAHAIIDVDAIACPRCAAGKGCGAGLIGSGTATRRLDLPVDAELGLAVGESVSLRLAPANLLRASWIAYGLPLAGALGAGLVSYALSFGEAAAAGAVFAGIAAGVMAGRRRLRREDCLQQFVPIVDRMH